MVKKCNSSIMIAMYAFVFNFPESAQYRLIITCSKSTIKTVEKEVINYSASIRKNTGQRKPVFLHILHSITFYMKLIFPSIMKMLTLFMMGVRQKGPPTSLSLSTSTKVGISPQTIWLLILTVLTHWCKISRSRLFPIPYYWTWTKSIPLKIWFFWRNPYKTDVMTAPLIEMLDLPNFGLMTSSTV